MSSPRKHRKLTTRSVNRLVMVLPLLIAAHEIIISHDFGLYLANHDHYDRVPFDPIAEQRHQQSYGKEYQDAPLWSAFERQHCKNTTKLDSRLRWKETPHKRHQSANPRRNAIEVLTYGISGAFPWYGRILPAIRFDLPYKKSTKLEIAMVEGIVDATFDLHQCTDGRNYENQTEPTDGYYDACFAAAPQDRKYMKDLCYIKRSTKETLRKFDYPAPGHERWSCHDTHVMEQLVGAQILDYLIGHGDRFYRTRTKNIFFFPDERPMKLVSIDHDSKLSSFYNNNGRNLYKHRVKLQYLLTHDMPRQLREEIKNVFLHGTKEEFVNKVNATLRGQLDNLNSALVDVYKDDHGSKELPFVTDILWNRLEGLVEFFNVTIDEE